MAECGDVVVVPGDTTLIVQDDPQTLIVSTTDSLVVVGDSPDVLLVEQPAVIILESNGGSGPAGAPGPPGPAGGVAELVAAENISAFAVVAMNGAGEAYLPSNLTHPDAVLIVGIAQTAALTGETVPIQTTGIMDTTPAWTPGPLYLDATDGALTSTPPSAPAYQFWVATAGTSSKLIIRPLYPIFLV